MHVSLSKLFLLRKHQVSPFLDKLALNLYALPCPRVYVYGDYQVLHSTDNRTGYLCLRVEHRGDALGALVRACDAALKDFSQVTLTLTLTLTVTPTLLLALTSMPSLKMALTSHML